MSNPYSLTRQNVWAVCGPHPDDGYPTEFSYWEYHNAAVAALESMKRQGYKDLALNEVDVYYDKNSPKSKSYYRLKTITKIMVNPPSRESILAKLTPDEIEFLGLKR